jgi:hypothetical protein
MTFVTGEKFFSVRVEYAVGIIGKYDSLFCVYLKRLMLILGKVEAEKYLITTQFYGVLLLGEVFITVYTPAVCPSYFSINQTKLTGWNSSGIREQII